MDNTITVEMRVDGVFTDITHLDEDTKVLASGNVKITRGSQDTQDEIPPGQVQFRYRDNNAYLDGQNPASPLWRKIGEATDVQVKVAGAVQVGSATELKSVAPSWDESDEHVVADVVCSDVVDRLSAHAQPLDSALTRYYRSLLGTVDAPVHWWPFEEGSEATRAEDSAGTVPLLGIAVFGNTSAPPGGIRSLQTKYEARPAPLADNSTNLSNQSPTGSVAYLGLDWAVDVSCKVPGDVVTGDTNPINIVEWRTHGLSGFWQIQVNPTTKCLDLYFFNTPLSTFTLTGLEPVRDGQWHHVRVEVTHSAPNFTARLLVDNAEQDSQLVTGATTSVPKLVRVYNDAVIGSQLRPAVAHLVLWGPNWPDNELTFEAFLGHAGETEIERVERVSAEEGIDVASDGYTTGSITLGPQGANTYIDIVQAAVATNAGIVLAHPTLHNTLRHRQRLGLYSRPAAVSLTYGHLAPGFRPSSDDQRRTNDVTAKSDRSADRSSEAGTYRYTIPDGDWFHWTTEPPPAGCYPRPSTATFNPADATELHELAAWKAHLGSWREKRFAQIRLNLHSAVFDAADIAAVRALDVGDVIDIDMTGAPPWVPYDSIRVTVRGFTRTLTKHTDTYDIATTPADAWEVEYVDGDATLVAGIGAATTAALIASAADSPPWDTAAEPYYLQLNGDPVKVTAMTIDTPGLIAAGTPAHADNAAVAPSLPAGITANFGHSLYLFAANRNTAATISAPAGWTLIDTGQTHVKLWHRYYVTGDTAPTVTPSGGAAGDTVSAVIVAFANTTPVVDNTDGSGGIYVSTNTSAQNIAYGSLLLRTARTKGLRERNVLQLILAWKQDDYTSVSAPAGFTELFEASTVTGNDQSLYGAARVVTDPTAVAAGSITVTGGAAAVSKAITIALRPTQTATIVRDVAGVAVAHTAADPVHVWRPGLMGL
jgi:hypothetical protein